MQSRQRGAVRTGAAKSCMYASHPVRRYCNRRQTRADGAAAAIPKAFSFNCSAACLATPLSIAGGPVHNRSSSCHSHPHGCAQRGTGQRSSSRAPQQSQQCEQDHETSEAPAGHWPAAHFRAASRRGTATAEREQVLPRRPHAATAARNAAGVVLLRSAPTAGISSSSMQAVSALRRARAPSLTSPSSSSPTLTSSTAACCCISDCQRREVLRVGAQQQRTSFPTFPERETTSAWMSAAASGDPV